MKHFMWCYCKLECINNPKVVHYHGYCVTLLLWYPIFNYPCITQQKSLTTELIEIVGWCIILYRSTHITDVLWVSEPGRKIFYRKLLCVLWCGRYLVELHLLLTYRKPSMVSDVRRYFECLNCLCLPDGLVKWLIIVGLKFGNITAYSL